MNKITIIGLSLILTIVVGLAGCGVERITQKVIQTQTVTQTETKTQTTTALGPTTTATTTQTVPGPTTTATTTQTVPGPTKTVTVVLTSTEPTATPTPEAAVTITDWEQEYYELLEEWSYLYIYYVVENTGDIEIYEYYVYFTVRCKGGKEFYPKGWGFSVPVGKKVSDYSSVNVGNNQVISVAITDWELYTSPFD